MRQLHLVDKQTRGWASGYLFNLLVIVSKKLSRESLKGFILQQIDSFIKQSCYVDFFENFIDRIK